MKEDIRQKQIRHLRRQRRARARIRGTAARPRLAVSRSRKGISVQLIDDQAEKTLASASDRLEKKGTKTERAALVGRRIAELAKGLKVEKVVFDRGGWIYHGRIKALAEAARAAGLEF